MCPYGLSPMGAHSISALTCWAGGAQGVGECPPASQVCYLGSLASEASFEDDVGRGPPLLRSLALASEASAGARKETGGQGKADLRGQGQAREGGRAPPRHSLSQTTSLACRPCLHPASRWPCTPFPHIPQLKQAACGSSLGVQPAACPGRGAVIHPEQQPQEVKLG